MKIGRGCIQFIIFVAALGAAIALTRMVEMRFQTTHLPPLALPSPFASPLPLKRGVEIPARISVQGQQLSIDIAKKKSYTTLLLKLQDEKPGPERVWVSGYYFSPDEPGKRWPWTKAVEVRRPFADSARKIITFTDECQLCHRLPGGKSTYYARIYASTESAAEAIFWANEGSDDSVAAVPVLVQGINRRLP